MKFSNILIHFCLTLFLYNLLEQFLQLSKQMVVFANKPWNCDCNNSKGHRDDVVQVNEAPPWAMEEDDLFEENLDRRHQIEEAQDYREWVENYTNEITNACKVANSVCIFSALLSWLAFCINVFSLVIFSIFLWVYYENLSICKIIRSKDITGTKVEFQYVRKKAENSEHLLIICFIVHFCVIFKFLMDRGYYHILEALFWFCILVVFCFEWKNGGGYAFIETITNNRYVTVILSRLQRNRPDTTALRAPENV